MHWGAKKKKIQQLIKIDKKPCCINFFFLFVLCISSCIYKSRQPFFFFFHDHKFSAWVQIPSQHSIRNNPPMFSIHYNSDLLYTIYFYFRTNILRSIFFLSVSLFILNNYFGVKRQKISLVSSNKLDNLHFFFLNFNRSQMYYYITDIILYVAHILILCSFSALYQFHSYHRHVDRFTSYENYNILWHMISQLCFRKSGLWYWKSFVVLSFFIRSKWE